MGTITKKRELILWVVSLIALTSCSNNVCYEEDPVITRTEISSDSIFIINDENRTRIYKFLDPSVEEDRYEEYKEYEEYFITMPDYKLSDLGFFMRDLYTGARVDGDTTFVGKKFGIYGANLLHNQGQLVLTNGNTITFARIGYMDYDEVLMYLIQYFKDNDIDERLLPIYVNRVSKLWLNNARSYHEFGKWYKWFNEPEKDSIAKEYGKYMDFLK